jgi:phage-related minor tail protein
MTKAKKRTARGRKQDRARVAGGQKYEVSYEAKKTGRSASAVKKAVKKVGSSRKKVERTLGRKGTRMGR